MNDVRNVVPVQGLAVIGMGRSGTSALTGMLVGAGFSVGDPEDVLGADESNPTGHHEKRVMWEFNDTLLAAAGGAWDDPPARDAVLEHCGTAGDDIGSLLEQLVEQARPAPLVVKDPRIPILLPVWWPVIRQRLRPVLIVRNPLEIALSLARRDDKPIAQGLALWEFSWRAILSELNGQDVYVVSYERLLADPSEFTGLVDWARQELAPNLAAHVAENSTGQLSATYRRNRATSEELSGYATAAQSTLWDYMNRLSSGPQTVDAPAELTKQNHATFVTLRAAADAAKELHRVRLDAESVWNSYRSVCADAAELNNQLADQGAWVAHLLQQLDTVNTENNQRGGRIFELESELQKSLDLAAAATASASAERAEAATSRLDAESARAEAASARAHAQAEQAHAAALSAELDAVRTAHAAILQSETWRIGNALVRPAHRIRTVVKRKSRGDLTP